MANLVNNNLQTPTKLNWTIVLASVERLLIQFTYIQILRNSF